MKNILSSRFEFNEYAPYKPSVSKTQRELIDIVKSKLRSGEYKLVKSSCPCGHNGEDDVTISEIDRYGLPLTSVICNKCGTVRFNPYLDQNSLADFYTNIYRKMYGMDVDDSNDYSEYISSQSGYSEKLLQFTNEFLTSSSRLCEVGCGGGGSVKFMQDHGYDAVGCDYDIAALQAGRDFGVKHLYYGDLNSIKENLGDVKFDLIYLHHVFEHLDQPTKFLEETKKYLTSVGRIVLIVPDISRIDQFGHLPALGNLLMYLHIAHKYNFSIEGIERVAGRARYSVEKVDAGRSSKSSSPWSSSPELWIQITPSNTSNERSSNTTSSKRTNMTLKYLQRTEKLFNLGLCRGQIAYKLSAVKSPKKISDKLKRLFR